MPTRTSKFRRMSSPLCRRRTGRWRPCRGTRGPESRRISRDESDRDTGRWQPRGRQVRVIAKVESVMADGLVKIRGVHKYFTRGSERIDVLKGVNLDIPAGDFLALMGPSGSGKTTLLNLMGGLDLPTEGSVKVGGVDISRLGAGALAKWRSQNVGFVFQLYNLLPVLTA